MKSVQKHRTAIMIMNVIIALLCIAAIAGYFFSPLLSVRVKVDLSAEDIQNIAGDVSVGNVKVVFPDPEPEEVGLSFSTMDLILPLVGGDPMGDTEELISEKADSIGNAIVPVVRSTVQQVAETTLVEVVRTEVSDIANDKAKQMIADAIPGISDEESQAILDEAQINDEYFAEKSEAALDLLNSGSANVEAVQDFANDTVSEVYDKLRSTGREEFSDLTLDDETKQEVNEIVEENIGELTDEEGNLTMDEIVDRILIEIGGSIGGSAGDGSASAEEGIALLSASSRAAAADGTSSSASSASEAEQQISSAVANYIRTAIVNESSVTIFFYVMIGFIVLTGISMLAWLYLLLKVFFKGFSMNPAVKLKVPILFLGWLPFLVFFLIPTAGMIAVNALGGFGAIISELSMIAGASFMTSGLFAFIAAVALVIIFIPYGIIRKQLKLELAPRVTPQEEAAYISQNPSLVPQEPIVKEHTVSGEPYLDEKLFEGDRKDDGSDDHNGEE